MYEISGLQLTDLPDEVEGIYENPSSAKRDLEYLRKRFPEIGFCVSRDGVPLLTTQLDLEIKSYEIAKVREESSRIPVTYRHGRGSEHDDVAIGPDGSPKKVWGPANPEDCSD